MYATKTKCLLHPGHRLRSYEFQTFKTGNIYTVIDDSVKNCTNTVDGQRMVLYERGNQIYVREYFEFFEKFVKIK